MSDFGKISLANTTHGRKSAEIMSPKAYVEKCEDVLKNSSMPQYSSELNLSVDEQLDNAKVSLKNTTLPYSDEYLGKKMSDALGTTVVKKEITKKFDLIKFVKSHKVASAIIGAGVALLAAFGIKKAIDSKNEKQ